MSSASEARPIRPPSPLAFSEIGDAALLIPRRWLRGRALFLLLLFVAAGVLSALWLGRQQADALFLRGEVLPRDPLLLRIRLHVAAIAVVGGAWAAGWSRRVSARLGGAGSPACWGGLTALAGLALAMPGLLRAGLAPLPFWGPLAGRFSPLLETDQALALALAWLLGTGLAPVIAALSRPEGVHRRPRILGGAFRWAGLMALWTLLEGALALGLTTALGPFWSEEGDRLLFVLAPDALPLHLISFTIVSTTLLPARGALIIAFDHTLGEEREGVDLHRALDAREGAKKAP